jgi:hypothetical protein
LANEDGWGGGKRCERFVQKDKFAGDANAKSRAAQTPCDMDPADLP